MKRINNLKNTAMKTQSKKVNLIKLTWTQKYNNKKMMIASTWTIFQRDIKVTYRSQAMRQPTTSSSKLKVKQAILKEALASAPLIISSQRIKTKTIITCAVELSELLSTRPDPNLCSLTWQKSSHKRRVENQKQW